MAKFNVVDMNGQHVSEIELSDAVFGITPNEKAVHIAVVNFLANQRQGTQNTKIRMEGLTVVLLWAPSPAATTTTSTTRSSAWLC